MSRRKASKRCHKGDDGGAENPWSNTWRSPNALQYGSGRQLLQTRVLCSPDPASFPPPTTTTTGPASPPALQKRVKMSTDGTSNSKHTATEQLFIDRLSARRLIDFRTHMYPPRFSHVQCVSLPRVQDLDHECIDLPVLEAFLEKVATGDLNASTRTDLSAADRRLLDTLSVREATAFRNHMHTLNDGGHEIIELLSDSESDGAEFDLEVTDILMHGASRSSSPIP
ncbi:hypothetical protein B0H13DRAFT_2294411 [Mycena leptocephala]|nr:hypothetical protein B0H13DRAFT_2294411 [Mycena leptocephala]